MSVAVRSNGHDTVREGATLGVLVATTTWLWVAGVDAFAGEPFRTFTLLGGIVIFTMIHYILNLVYGIVIVAVIHGTEREPTLMMAAVFGILMLEFAFALLAVVLSNLGLGELAWVRIFIGSVIGAGTAIAFLARSHPLAAQVRRAR
jgi:hypothetical protein